MNPSISLCMIVKDEARLIARCLGSVSGLVAEMIVVDTGSRDRTPEIARSMGAKVYPFAWTDDFSAARNESLGHATSPWILVLDGDELLDPSDHPAVRGLVERGGADGFRLVQRTYERSSKDPLWAPVGEARALAWDCPGYVPNTLVRLFRNLPEVRFKGRVHELVEHDLLAQGRIVQDTDIPIHHYGRILGRERLLGRYELYRRIGEQKVLSDPADGRALCELGVQKLAMGEPAEAEETLGEACRMSPEDPRAAFNLGLALGAQGKMRGAEEAYRRTLGLDPGHVGALNNLALLLQRSPEGIVEATGLYERCIERRPNHHVLRYNYGLLLEMQGQEGEARRQYRMALENEPAFEEARRQLASLDSAGAERATPRAGAGSPDLPDPEGRLQELESAVTLLEKNPEDCDLRFRCGTALENLGRLEDALEQYQEIMARNPDHPETLYRLALECRRQGMGEECVTLCRRLLTIRKDHPEAIGLLRELKDARNLPPTTRLHHAASPSRPLRIAFLWGSEPFLGDEVEKRPLGGTETAMIHMTRCLAGLGHEVCVFARSGGGEFQGVRYAGLETYLQKLRDRPVDVLVAARIFHPFLLEVPARVKLFWTQDLPNQDFVSFLSRPEVVRGIGRIITVSRWQARVLAAAYRIPLERFWPTRNGVCWDPFRALPEGRNRKRLVYTSTPFRGLDVLLETFPAIRERVPDAELDIYSSMAVYRVDPETDRAEHGPLYEKARQPGVSLKGSVLQKELAEALLRAGILAYPNHFAETSCIAAMEAMAAGLPVVTTSLGALPETVSAGGILIPGDPRSETYRERFVDQVCALLQDEERWQSLSAEARRRIYDHNRWETIAAEWAGEFERLLGQGEGLETSSREREAVGS